MAKMACLQSAALHPIAPLSRDGSINSRQRPVTDVTGTPASILRAPPAGRPPCIDYLLVIESMALR